MKRVFEKTTTSILCLGLLLAVFIGCFTFFSSCDSGLTLNTGTEETLDNPLATPTNLTVNSDGDYSFDAVENANYYFFYIFRADDATPDSDYLYLTKITTTGASTYTGNIVTDFSFTDPGYFSIQVVAYPVTGSNYDHSYRALTTYGKEGTLVAPIITPYTETETTGFNGATSITVSGGFAFDNNYGDTAPLVVYLDNKDALNGCLLRVQVYRDEAMTDVVMSEDVKVSCTSSDVICKTLIDKDETSTYYVKVTAIGDGTYLTPKQTESDTWSGTFYTLDKITY